MPLPLIPLIAAGAALASSGINAASTGATNKSSRKYNTEMYERQRKDALTDAAMQNQYNSPAAQMQRLQQAGLNPNLVYGQGATTQASPVRSSSVEGYHPQAPQVDLSGMASNFMTHYDIQLKQAQTDNLKQAYETAKHQQALTDAQTLEVNSRIPRNEVNTEQARFNLQKSQQLFPPTLEAATANVKKIYADTEKTKAETLRTNANTTFTQNQDRRNELLTGNTINKTTQDIITQRIQNSKTALEKQQIVETTNNLKNTGILQQLEIELNRKGLSTKDPAWQKVIGRILENPTSAVEKSKEILQQIHVLSGRKALWDWIHKHF